MPYDNTVALKNQLEQTEMGSIDFSKECWTTASQKAVVLSTSALAL